MFILALFVLVLRRPVARAERFGINGSVDAKVKACAPNTRAIAAQVVRAAQDVSFEVPRGQAVHAARAQRLRQDHDAALDRRPGAAARRARSRSADASVYSSSSGVFVPPNRRGFGMVFQSYAIWPHMTVFENAAFPLQVRRRRSSATRSREKVDARADAVQLDGICAEREATQLSGGQQQRLALARALVMEPRAAAARRAALQPRREAARAHALRAEAPAARARHHHRVRDARPERGAGAVARDRGDERGPHPADRHAARDLRAPGNAFVADFVGNTNFIDGTVRAAEAERRLLSRDAPRSATSRCSRRRPGAPATR